MCSAQRYSLITHASQTNTACASVGKTHALTKPAKNGFVAKPWYLKNTLSNEAQEIEL